MSSPTPPAAPATPAAAKPAPTSRLSTFLTVAVPRLCICTEGFDATGKSRFALTLPKPLAYFVLDRGFETGDPDELARLNLDGVDVGYYRFNKTGGADLAKDAQEDALGPLKKDWRAALASTKYRSVVLDTADEAWELVRMARYGRLEKIPPMAYGPLNAEYREAFLNEALRSTKNVVWVHKKKKEYDSKLGKNKAGDTVEVSEWNGKYKRAGFGGFQYDAPIRIEHRKDLTIPVGQGRFSVYVEKCAQNASLEGQDLPEVDFATFAMMAMPNVDPSHWE